MAYSSMAHFMALIK